MNKEEELKRLEALIEHETEAVRKVDAALRALEGVDFKEPGYWDRSFAVLRELRRIVPGSKNYVASLRSTRKQMREALGLEV